MDNASITHNYLRGKLNQYTKSEIIEGLISAFDYSAIDRLSHYIAIGRVEREIATEEKRTEMEKETLRDSVNEYNKLVMEARSVGLENMSLQKIQRMSALLDIIRKGGKK